MPKACFCWILFWSGSVFATSPVPIHFSMAGESVLLACDVEWPNENAIGEISYQWYLGAEPIEGATGYEYATEEFDQAGCRQYNCVKKNLENLDAVLTSMIVVFTGLPTVKIQTVDGEMPTTDIVYGPTEYSQSIANATKVPSSMQIYDASGNLLYESGEYQKKKSGLTIKIRGNTSVKINGKSSYKLKLQKEADLLSALVPRDTVKWSASDYADKNWILLASTETSHTWIGFKICDIVGFPWTPEYAFVNVFINGDYRGLYLLMESINQGPSRVNISDDGYIIERDAYWWNEDVWFKTERYGLEYTFKYPDEDDVTAKQLEYIQNLMDDVETHITDGTYEDILDVESFARWILVHDLLGSWDAAGSNAFMAKENSADSKIYMLSNWDFDSNFIQEDEWGKQHNLDRAYAVYLFRSVNTTFINRYKDLFDSIQPMLLSAFQSWMEELETALEGPIDISRYCDSARWNSPWRRLVDGDYHEALNWFERRLAWMNEAMAKSYGIVYELNGGRLDYNVEYPDSIRFLSRIDIPQAQRNGFEFVGWSVKEDTTPRINKRLYGYHLTEDVALTAHWADISLDTTAEDSVSKAQKDISTGMYDVFNSLGQYLGRKGLQKIPTGPYFTRKVK